MAVLRPVAVRLGCWVGGSAAKAGQAVTKQRAAALLGMAAGRGTAMGLTHTAVPASEAETLPGHRGTVEMPGMVQQEALTLVKAARVLAMAAQVCMVVPEQLMEDTTAQLQVGPPMGLDLEAA
jgi:hypothetical protein